MMAAGLVSAAIGCGPDSFRFVSASNPLPTASAPVFTPAAGTYSVAQSVTLTDATAGAAIYYTTNGTTPTTASTLYSGPIPVSSTETIEAVAVAAGYQNSAVATASYTIAAPLPAASAPVFTPPGGTYSVAQSVTLTDATAGAAIYYTTNGTTPTVASTLYSGPIPVSSTETIEAVAVAAGYNNSAVASASYTIGTTTPATGQWTWMAGSSTTGAAGIYGTKGVAAAGNSPGGRVAATRWTDGSGNLWLFGGGIFNTAGYMNDLWKFNPATAQWMWVSGSQTPNAAGVYGAMGVPSPSNVPPPRLDAQSWVDASGNLWMFGGGYQTTASVVLDDLWKFDPATTEWTWMGGTTTYGQTGSYGTLGVASPTNMPSARDGAATFTDRLGNFWMFGGFNQNPNFGNDGYLNDLWEFNPSTLEWTWMSGSNVFNQPGNYGTLGVAAAGNVPGARVSPVGWTDQSGNLWLFGGDGYDSSGSNQGELLLNDLWKFDPATKQWAWMSGSSLRDAIGVYGSQGVPAAGNVPSSRYEGNGWVDSHGDLWMFGGVAVDTALGGVPILINDMWRYQIGTNAWTWMAGSKLNEAPGVYGTLGVPSASNTPGAREGISTWTDSSGNLWLFGGFGTASINDSGGLNDMWRYQP